MGKIRVRFAPSPTGPLHIGGARSALFNYLLAAKEQGDFILRVEDTDLERSSRQSEQNIIESLRWLGIEWNEGIDKGGAYGPYRQTERIPLYQAAAAQLITNGQAYNCYCSEQDLEEIRQAQQAAGQTPHYSGACRSLSTEEHLAKAALGQKAVIRFVVPKNQELIIEDMVRGQVKVNSDEIGGDFVIIKSDGLPTYNFAAVVDDYLMKITHVVRGEEHLPNTPRQLLMYNALGYPPPIFAHVSLILGSDGSKMSKRHGSVSVVNYQEQGFLPEALVNFLALLGWSPEGEQEILSMEQLKEQFSLNRVSKSPAVFDIAKLRWLNAQYLRTLTQEEIAAGIAPYLSPDFDEKRTLLLAETLAHHLETFAEVQDYLPLIEGALFFTQNEEAKNVLAQEHAPGLIKAFAALIENMREEEFIPDTIKGAIKQAGKESCAKGAALYMVLRVAITGCMHGPDLDKLAALIGREKLLTRLKNLEGIL
ncbi:MAG: glutamate--tRNA ligase [Clostridiales bacterium]|nr:glutamate--tRNA ligase [Clostridiales bacterium]